jgi:hypothetical protein
MRISKLMQHAAHTIKPKDSRAFALLLRLLTSKHTVRECLDIGPRENDIKCTHDG